MSQPTITPRGSAHVAVTLEYDVTGAEPMKARYSDRDFSPSRVRIEIVGGRTVGVSVSGGRIIASGKVSELSMMKVDYYQFDLKGAPEWIRDLALKSELQVNVAGVPV